MSLEKNSRAAVQQKYETSGAVDKRKSSRPYLHFKNTEIVRSTIQSCVTFEIVLRHFSLLRSDISTSLRLRAAAQEDDAISPRRGWRRSCEVGRSSSLVQRARGWSRSDCQDVLRITSDKIASYHPPPARRRGYKYNLIPTSPLSRREYPNLNSNLTPSRALDHMTDPADPCLGTVQGAREGARCINPLISFITYIAICAPVRVC